jgi:protein TonB
VERVETANPTRLGAALGFSLLAHLVFLLGWQQPQFKIAPPSLSPSSAALSFTIQSPVPKVIPAPEVKTAPPPVQAEVSQAQPEVLPPPIPVPPVADPQPVVRPKAKPLPTPQPQPKAVAKPNPAPKRQPAPVAETKVAPVPQLAPAPSSSPPADPADPVVRRRYEQQLFTWLSRYKDYPMMARRRGIEGTARLRIKLARSGKVLSAVLVTDTGSSILDQAALRMVERATPFPSMPDTYSGDSFTFVAPVDFKLR